jgi:long-subunit acyl-CoA synthetase (AMP-forming)
MVSYMRKTQKINEGHESYCSYLPLAHMFERCAQATMQGLGARIGFFQGVIHYFLFILF